MSAHTPGPWEACDSASITMNDEPVAVPSHVCRRRRDEQGRRVTEFIADCNMRLPEANANARLIAAAPELLALVRDAIEHDLAGDRLIRARKLLASLDPQVVEP